MSEQPLPPWLLQYLALQFSLPPVSKGPSPGHHPSHQGVVTMDSQEKETGEEFKTYDLVDINGGLWYGVPIFTFWWEQVDKGAMPEPDMVFSDC